MNLILIDESEVRGKKILLCDRRAEHMVKVLRVVCGDEVKIGIINGLMGKGVVERIKKKYPFEVELTVDFFQEPPERPFLDLILALPRPIMLKRILTQITALGVGTIHLVNANRVEKSFWEATVLQEKGYEAFLFQGLEQAVDTRVPEVIFHKKFKLFLEDYFPTIADGTTERICAHPTGDISLIDAVKTGNGRVVLAIGPEGGWIDYEVEKFQAQGFHCCTIGNRILKVDTAVIALHSRISALREKQGNVGRL